MATATKPAACRLPGLIVPLATYTGWNPRDPATGGAGQIVNMQGSTIPFPKTADDRERGGDPRPAIAERYHDREDYLGGTTRRSWLPKGICWRRMSRWW